MNWVGTLIKDEINTINVLLIEIDLPDDQNPPRSQLYRR